MKPPALNIDLQLGAPNYHGKMERRVIANLLDHVKKAGFTILGIHNGEHFTKTHNAIKDSMEVIFNLDESWIHITDPAGKHRHTIFIVLGNEEPEDIICDWTFTNDDPDNFNATMEKFEANKYA